MIDAREFERKLFAWMDGELPEAEAREMEAYASAHPDAAARAEAERAFDERVKMAIVSDGRGRELVMEALRKAQAAPAAETPAPVPAAGGPAPSVPAAPAAAGGRPLPQTARSVHRLPRALPRLAVAAAAALVVGVMWWNCVPPFGCGTVEALEKAAHAPATGALDRDGTPGETVAAKVAGCDCEIWRSRVPVGTGEAMLLFCPDAERPTFRLERKVDGETWWVGREGESRVVVFEEPSERTRGLWCLVGPQDEESLLRAAQAFRAQRARTSK